MAKIIYETRTFTDRNTGITTEYDYIAIQGSDSKSIGYEVQLKNLVQSEKMVLKMLSEFENKEDKSEVTTSKGGDVTISKKSNDNDPFFSNMNDSDTIDLEE